MKMSKAFIGLVSGLALLVLLVINAPARLLLSVLPQEQVILQGVEGSLWQGKASRTLVAIDGGWLQLGASQWQLNPLSLLLFSPRIQLSSQWGRQNLQARVKILSATDFELGDLDLSIDAGLLRQFMPVGLVGELSAQFEQLLIRQNMPVHASGRIVWQGGGWISPQGRKSLGSYAVDIATDPDGLITGQVITLAGPLQAEGDLSLRQAQYAVDIHLHGPGLQDPQLSQALQLVAAPTNGGFRAQLKGEL